MRAFTEDEDANIIAWHTEGVCRKEIRNRIKCRTATLLHRMNQLGLRKHQVSFVRSESVKLSYNSSLTLKELSNEFGVGRTTIGRYLSKGGVKVQPCRSRLNTVRDEKWAQMRTDGMLFREIAEQSNVNLTTVQVAVYRFFARYSGGAEQFTKKDG